jgi:hypothetical protein
MELLPIDILDSIAEQGVYAEMLSIPAFARSITPDRRIDWMISLGWTVYIKEYGILWTRYGKTVHHSKLTYMRPAIYHGYFRSITSHAFIYRHKAVIIKIPLGCNFRYIHQESNTNRHLVYIHSYEYINAHRRWPRHHRTEYGHLWIFCGTVELILGFLPKLLARFDQLM